MTLDEAIEHCDEVASNNETCEECSSDHKQLKSWLIELKSLRTYYDKAMEIIAEKCDCQSCWCKDCKVKCFDADCYEDWNKECKRRWREHIENECNYN